MKNFDYQYRYKLASNIPQFIAFFETTSHLENVDPYFTPFEAAKHFLDFWSNKYESSLSNLLHRNFAEAYRQQLILAKKRFFKVQNGGELILADFKSQNLNFFDENYSEFSNAIFLMETFYEDPSMFFENYEDFVDSSQKNNILEIIGDVESQKKNDNVENPGDFAKSQHKNGIFESPRDLVDSHSKNDIYKKLGDLADSHPKNGSFAICGFFAFFHYKKGNFRIFMIGRFCNTQPPYFCIFARFDKLMSRVGLSRIQFHGGRGHRFLLTLENKISKFKTFNKARIFYRFSSLVLSTRERITSGNFQKKIVHCL